MFISYIFFIWVIRTITKLFFKKEWRFKKWKKIPWKIDCNVDKMKVWLHYGFGLVFNATFDNISVMSWWSVLLVKETRGHGENHQPVASHCQTLSHNIVHLTLIEIRTQNISGDRHWFHTITVKTAPLKHTEL